MYDYKFQIRGIIILQNICVCVHVCVSVCVCVCVCVCVNMFTYDYIHMIIYIYIYIYIYTIYIIYVFIHINIHKYTRIHIMCVVYNERRSELIQEVVSTFAFQDKVTEAFHESCRI